MHAKVSVGAGRPDPHTRFGLHVTCGVSGKSRLVNVANIFDEISMQLATNLDSSFIVVLSKEPLPWPPLLGLARVSHLIYIILQVTTLTRLVKKISRVK
jgi:hypothetical protein